GKMIADSARDFGHKKVIYEKDKEKVPKLLNSIVEEGDIIITMGAGDIWKFGEQFIKELKS
ncbi:MAG: UDP-N-acetylmuramate--L-alanine ligase, partial [Melioribacteraceae bacterium]|nr:UDP-N-acetylmuramate--L-alanine ligase [Melioribacteraceae bacterium]